MSQKITIRIRGVNEDNFLSREINIIREKKIETVIGFKKI